MENIFDYPGLYMIEAPNGKRYIGVAGNSFRKRFSTHVAQAKAGKRSSIGAAIRKFGVSAMKFIPLVVCADKDELMALEIRAIAVYDTMLPHGLNRSPGGTVTSEATKARLSRKLRGRVMNPAWRSKLGKNRKAVTVEGILYPSVKAAGAAFGLGRVGARNRFESANYTTWIMPGLAKVEKGHAPWTGRPKGSSDKQPRSPGRWPVVVV